VAGFAIGGPWGAVFGGAIGGLIGGFVGAFAPNALGGDCQNCSGGATDPSTCGVDNQGVDIPCVSGCCANGNPPIFVFNFLTGTNCSNGGAACQMDSQCGSGLICLQDCCTDPATICQNSGTCTSDANCAAGNTCHFGCCVGPCGVNGTSCDVVLATSCSVPVTCGGGDFCNEGCCVIP
jgi:hypothetical protein